MSRRLTKVLHRLVDVLLPDEQSLDHTLGSVHQVCERHLGGSDGGQGSLEVERKEERKRKQIGLLTPHFSSPDIETRWYSFSRGASFSWPPTSTASTLNSLISLRGKDQEIRNHREPARPPVQVKGQDWIIEAFQTLTHQQGATVPDISACTSRKPTFEQKLLGVTLVAEAFFLQLSFSLVK